VLISRGFIVLHAKHVVDDKAVFISESVYRWYTA
jgi:hypothetical protein